MESFILAHSSSAQSIMVRKAGLEELAQLVCYIVFVEARRLMNSHSSHFYVALDPSLWGGIAHSQGASSHRI